MLCWSGLTAMPEVKTLPWAGEDPLADDQNERDINSVAGVLKLYFRGLENPLFPKERFQDLVSTISKYMTCLLGEQGGTSKAINRANTPVLCSICCKKGYRSAMEIMRKRH